MVVVSVVLTIVSLCIIIYTALQVQSLAAKTAVYLCTGGISAGMLWFFGGHEGQDVVRHVFAIEYPQFIFIPLVTVLIASLALFRVEVTDENAKLGWFLFVAPPLIGNLATTWAVAPVILSVAMLIRQQYPKRWLAILIQICAFSMNFLAVFTLIADPPQGFWKIKLDAISETIGFMEPAAFFWVYGLVTWLVYAICLKRLGVQFGHIKNLFRVRPASIPKLAFGLLVAGSIIYALVYRQGYEITLVLAASFAATCGAAFLLFSSAFGREERHHTFHWSVDTAAIFIGFFGVVAYVHFLLHNIRDFPKPVATLLVVIQTLLVDNVAAFSSMYPVFENLPREFMAWQNLLPSIVFGGTSPLGNGPQIVLFLIILVSLKSTTTREIFIQWIKEACVFMPYLGTWVLSAMIMLEHGITFSVPIQLLVGILSVVIVNQMMDLQTNYRIHADEGWSGKAILEAREEEDGQTNKEGNGETMRTRPQTAAFHVSMDLDGPESKA